MKRRTPERSHAPNLASLPRVPTPMSHSHPKGGRPCACFSSTWSSDVFVTSITVGETMSNHRPSRKDLEALCSGVGPEDGVDPRYSFTPPEGRQVGRKQLQLCRQVSRTLVEVLAGCADGVLRELEVGGVTPVAGPGRLLVTLRPSASASVTDPVVILGHLARAHGMLRQEVARAVHRRKAPELLVQLSE